MTNIRMTNRTQVIQFQMMEEKLRFWAFFTGIAALIVSTVLNILYRGEYFLMGVNFIYNYQSDSASKAITVIQNLISILGNTFFIVAFLLLIHLLSYRKLNTIVYIFYIVINAYFIAVQKQAFQDPRPFFYNTQIQALEWTCPRSFGFPSGHSWVSILLYEPIFSDMIGTKGYKKFALLVAVLTGILIPISRQYLGSHTADQVTSGVLHSLAALIFYRYFLHQKIWNFLNRICLGLSSTLATIITTIIFLISIAVPFIIYAININHRQFNPNFITALNVACNKVTSQDEIQKEAGTAAAIIGLVFGIIYGLMISNSKRMEESLSHDKLLSYLIGNWNFGGRFLNIVKFILIYVLCGGLTVGVLGFAIPSATNNFYGKYILQTAGFCLFGMCITWVIPLLLIKVQSVHIIVQQKQPPHKTREMMQSPKTTEKFQPKVKV